MLGKERERSERKRNIHVYEARFLVIIVWRICCRILFKRFTKRLSRISIKIFLINEAIEHH